ncbi:sigma-70 family RNA polymerase sigma factor [Paenibacillus sacheonensis]|uniref:Sigma-70 family RNA polymerase sigma factor n=1 Tax=Paenibacillus sacheonensis TaxID=742054 RepID=A0A7X4YVS0_9BACL|nr:sigma-70 family RNA polymerase sigma factor [Paenibacillus sacheonensis]MBM7568633.1 RNA polymerase sigma-70 factor (ECF subfamily) [Paenibacillus sacheonensis]NBC72474.1 sigma-70 family RNA polymerase sigma factor [Paenibacillus sacheonensis]
MMDHSDWLIGLRPDLLRYCRSLCGRGTQGWEAEDVAQEVVTKLLGRRAQDPEFRPTKTYVLRTARNLWIDRLRKRQEVPVPDMPEWLETSAYRDESPYATRELLDTLIRRLPPRPFVILLLCDIFGFTAKETANCIDSAEVAVQVALSRARSRLRQLASREPGPDAAAASASISVPQARLLDEVAEAFRRHDPKRIYQAYLRLYESGATITRIRTSPGGILSFTFRDPDGNLLMVSG